MVAGKTVTAELASATPGPTTNPWFPNEPPTAQPDIAEDDAVGRPDDANRRAPGDQVTGPDRGGLSMPVLSLV